MGILDKLLRRKKKEEEEREVKYILKRRGESGGMEKVAELQEPTPIENLYKTLTPGIYSLHKYKKGQTGFDVVWGPAEVLGDAEEKTEGVSGVRKSPFSAMKEQLQGFKDMKDEMKELGALFVDMFSEKKVTMDDAMGYFETLKKHKDTLDGLFPGAVTGDKYKIPLSGTIPAWLAFVPQVIDQSTEALEKRLIRWGLVEGEGMTTMSKEEDPIRLPEKPKVVTVKEKEEPKEEDKEIVIELPKKPVVKEEKKDEVREAEIGEEKEEGEEKDGGEGTE